MSRRYSFESTDEPFQPIYRQQTPPQSQAPPYHSQRRRSQQQNFTAPRNSPPAPKTSYSPPRQSPPRTYVAPLQIQTQQHSYPPLAYTSPPRSPATSPAAHLDSTFNRLRAARRYSRDRENSRPLQDYSEPVSPIPAPPPPPVHRDAEGRIWGRELGYTNSAYSNITPGADNYGEQAAGGITGIAMGVADANARQSGLDAMRNTPGYDPNNELHMHDYQSSPYQQSFPHPRSGSHPSQTSREGSYTDQYARPMPHPEQSHSSLTPLGAAAFPPGIATPSRSTVSRSPHSFNNDLYTDNPYNRYSRTLDPTLTSGFDPNSIEDDGDDGLDYRAQHRGSLMSMGHSGSDRAASGAVAGGAAAGGIMGTLGGFVGRSTSGTPQYNPVTNPAAPTAYPGPNEYDQGPEKSEWLSKQSTGKKKLKWTLGILVLVLVLGGIGGGVAAAILTKKHKSSSNTTSGASAVDDTKNNGDLDKNSGEIQALLNNKNIHKVFPGVDYTPMYTQYPDCLSYPASQNNVTRDLAVLSQMTNTLRLYGTDCNQTELVLHAIDRLGLTGKMKLWLGVWQDKNATTNARQLAQMYDIVNKYGADPFVGIVIGNEVLFRQDMTETELVEVIAGVKKNLTESQPSITLPIASSDLGDNWTAAFANQVDYVMANIHPFFAGVEADVAASWTWSFWNNKDIPLKADKSKSIISETGWPSKGGTDCGAATTCAVGSVAGIPEMNTFMETWVCDALSNSTNYFWFEAFDEPWKWKFNEPGKEWEDQWGLMDVNRNLKPGVKIPDCGGATVDGMF